MPGTAIGMSFNYGFAGMLSRGADSHIESKIVNSGSGNINFGTPVIQNTDDTIGAASGSLTAANFGGIAAAIIKQSNTYPNTGASGFYAPYQQIDVIKRGIVAVKIAQGNPTTGGAVYVRIALNGAFPSEVIGDFRAAADGGNTVQLTNCSWHTNRKDANNITELKLKYPNN